MYIADSANIYGNVSNYVAYRIDRCIHSNAHLQTNAYFVCSGMIYTLYNIKTTGREC